MLQVARLSPKLLGDSCGLIVNFLHSRHNQDGGFSDRNGDSDLYYTVFGTESLIALQSEVPHSSIAQYLLSFGDGEGLDLVHLCCLARCRAALPESEAASIPSAPILQRIESFRSDDGGYNTVAGAQTGTVYGCFLALGAYQDLGSEMPEVEKLLKCVAILRSEDGGYANQQGMAVGLTPATAAAVTLSRQLKHSPDRLLSAWLLARCHPEGGFFATPAAPIPDLLSTATALHALSGMQADFEAVKEPCLDFVDSLWSSEGAFYGHWADDGLDCEYTYYGLLALGHLSL